VKDLQDYQHHNYQNYESDNSSNIHLTPPTLRGELKYADIFHMPPPTP